VKQLKTISRDIVWNVVFERAPVPMAIVSKNGTFIEVNRRFTELLGYSADEFESRNFQSITHPDDLESDLAMVHKCVSGQIDSYEMVKRYLSKTGEIIWVKIAVQSVIEGDAMVCFFIVATPVKVAHPEKVVQEKRSFSLSSFFKQNWAVLIPWIVVTFLALYSGSLKVYDVYKAFQKMENRSQ
jgi:PAS domain S-box-containing protein